MKYLAFFISSQLPSVRALQTINIGVAGTDEDAVTDNGRGGLDRPAGFEGPLQGRLVGETGIGDTGQLWIPPEHRPIRGRVRSDGTEPQDRNPNPEENRNDEPHGTHHFPARAGWQTN